MASLKRPSECPQCHGNGLRKKVVTHTAPNYEGYICVECIQDSEVAVYPQAFIVYRPRRNKNMCRDCGAERGSKEFVDGRNQCVECRNKYNAQYNQENKVEIREHHRGYYQENKERIRARTNAYWQSTPGRFMSDLFHRTKKSAKKRIGGAERGLDFTLVRDDLTNLYESQEGLCAITGLPMEHKWSSLYSISIDRIDSDGDYILGNVQLVCKGVNYLKNTHLDLETREFFSDFFKTHFISEFCVRSKCQGCGTVDSCHIQKDCPFCDGKGQRTVLNGSAFYDWLQANGIQQAAVEQRREPELLEFGGQKRP